MTPDEQAALSAQHYGLWVVPLASGAVAVFTHPNGKLLAICRTLEEVLAQPIASRPHYPSPKPQIDLGDFLNDLL